MFHCTDQSTHVLLLVVWCSLCSVWPLQGLIFVVDSNDRERAQEAAEELQKMVSETHPHVILNTKWTYNLLICNFLLCKKNSMFYFGL